MERTKRQAKRGRPTLTDDDLCQAVEQWVFDLCSRKRDWTMSIPLNPDRDPDILICELVRRFKAVRARLLRRAAELPTDG